MNDYLRLTDDDRLELIPETQRDATMDFIENFRATQGERNTQLGESAHALGSDLAAPYGGLHGPSEYMKSRYQSPQTESRLANLRATAQLDALNKLMQNDVARYQAQVSNAYHNALAKTKASQDDVKVEEIEEYDTAPSLGLAAGEYSSEEAPQGVTRVYAGGTWEGRPLYTDTANGAESLNLGAGSGGGSWGDIPSYELNDGGFHVKTVGNTFWDWVSNLIPRTYNAG